MKNDVNKKGFDSTIKCEYPVVLVNPNIYNFYKQGFNRILLPGSKLFYLKDFHFVKDNKYKSRFVLRPGVIKIKESWLYVNDDELKNVPVFYQRLPLNFDFDNSILSRSMYHYKYYLTEDEIRNSFLIDDFGTCIPLFIIVPCGHCVLCRSKKVNILGVRNILQMCSEEYLPFFVTLTFNNKHLPEDKSLQTQTDIIQKFHKRLRRLLERSNYKTDFKYFCVSEFGSKRGRLHYHCIYYNVDVRLRTYDYFHRQFTFERFINKAWNQGFVNCQVKKKDSSFSYLTKYITKGVSGDNKKNTKSWKSIKLGVSTLYKYKDDIINLRMFDKFRVHCDCTGQDSDIPMYSFIKRELFPSLTRSLDCECRDKLLRLYEIYMTVPYPILPRKFVKYCQRFILLWRALEYTNIDFDYKINYNCDINRELKEICKYLDKKFEGVDIQKIINDNELYRESIVMTNDESFDIDFLKGIEYSRVEEYFNLENDEQ